MTALDEKPTDTDDESGANENATEFPAPTVDVEMSTKVQELSVPEKQSEVHALSEENKVGDTNSSIGDKATVMLMVKLILELLIELIMELKQLQSLAVNLTS